VFLDCEGCYAEYLRDEIKWVDFVRQPQDADVYIFSSSQETGGGGREVVIRFVGNGRLDGVDINLRALTLTGDPLEVRRRAVFQTVSVGLLSYLARAGLPGSLDITVEPAEVEGGTPSDAGDPWNFWLYSVRGSLEYNAEESARDLNLSARFSADRITERWKITVGGDLSQRRETFDLDEEDSYRVTRRSRNLRTLVVRSAGPHWSFGLSADVGASTFGNTRFESTIAPAVEYSVFPYADYASRRFFITYYVGTVHARYNEITLFDKLQETLWGHELAADLELERPWGSLQTGVEWTQYFHDATKNRLVVDGDISIRITRGLSVTVEWDASRIRDQLSLPRRGATPEEVLLRVRELQSGYDVQFDVGFTYSFGSLFNNIVNPRFGG